MNHRQFKMYSNLLLLTKNMSVKCTLQFNRPNFQFCQAWNYCSTQQRKQLQHSLGIELHNTTNVSTEHIKTIDMTLGKLLTSCCRIRGPAKIFTQGGQNAENETQEGQNAKYFHSFLMFSKIPEGSIDLPDPPSNGASENRCKN